jgi:spore coat protein U-like protein
MKILGGFGLMMALAGTAAAGNAQSNINVSASVTATCSISAGAMAFGSYDPVAGSQVDGQATLTVSCTKGATATITLGQGSNASGASTDTAPVRRMKDSGTNMLSYALFSDSNRSVTWGNTAGTGVSYTSAGSASQPILVYGRIAASQDLPAGSYTDTVVATITF